VIFLKELRVLTKVEIIEKQLKIKRSKFVRTIFWPIMNLKRLYMLITFQKSKDASKIRELKNIYENNRCFIIGNGPSLTIQDLEKISAEYTFASNRIYSLFDKTKWRPTFYLCVDPEAIRMDSYILNSLKAHMKFFDVLGKKCIQDITEKTHFLYNHSVFFVNPYKISKPFVSEDASKMLSMGQTVTFTSIQLAIYMGFKEIYLLGVDHNYAKKIDSKGCVVEDSNVKNYCEGISNTKISVQFIDGTTAAYKASREYADLHGVKIYNVTRGGKLEVFDRIDFDRLF
jgi:hypothetical protein